MPKGNPAGYLPRHGEKDEMPMKKKGKKTMKGKKPNPFAKAMKH